MNLMADLISAPFLVEGLLLLATIGSITALRRSGRTGGSRTLN
jgi:hypothetical protein